MIIVSKETGHKTGMDGVQVTPGEISIAALLDSSPVHLLARSDRIIKVLESYYPSSRLSLLDAKKLKDPWAFYTPLVTAAEEGKILIVKRGEHMPAEMEYVAAQLLRGEREEVRVDPNFRLVIIWDRQSRPPSSMIGNLLISTATV